MCRKSLLTATILTLSVTISAQFSTNSSQLREHVGILASDSLLGRGFGSPQGVKAALYIARQFELAGIDPIGDGFLHPFNHRSGILNISGNNVVGIIHGNDPDLKDEYIVLGAHYDHLGWKIEHGDSVVYNGADDNASGTAALIEIGRNLAASRASLGRSVVLVAFDGEESGLVGSKRFMSDSTVQLHRVKLMFSLDMVGMAEAHKGVDLIGINLLDDADYLVNDLAGKYNLKITKANSANEQHTDTAPFGNSGIPAVAVFTGTESPYHKPEDTHEKLDYKGMAGITNYISDATMQLSTREKISDRPGISEGEGISGKKGVFRTGIRINAGSGSHNYRDRFYKGKTIITGSAGLFANIRAARFLHIQPELLYETKGSEHENGVFRTHSVTTPLNFQIAGGDSDFRTYLQLGGYFSYHFGGNIGGTSIDFENEFSDQEYGLTFGFGFEIMNVQWGFTFLKGLTDLNLVSGNRILQENFYFTLGYIF